MAKKRTLYALGTVLSFGVSLFLCGAVLAVQTIQPNVPSSQVLLSTDSPDNLAIRVAAKAPKPPKIKPPNGKAMVTWDPPAMPGVKKKDMPFFGYKVYMGTASKQYTSVIDVGAKTKLKLTQLPDGTYYFAVTSYDKDGDESIYSAEVSKTIN